jgi:cholesterol transport system auxiliary component
MKNMILLGLLIISTVFVNGCSELIPKAPELPSFYILNGVNIDDKKEVNEPLIPQNSGGKLREKKLVTATLKVNTSSATAGFDSARMVYSRVPYKLEYFAHNEWIDTPARMLTPLIVSTLKEKSLFSAVTLSPNSVDSNFSLDTEIIRLQQDFFTLKSRERLTVRATLIDNVKHTVIFVHELDVVVTSKTENPYGGVIAANEAVVKLLDDLVLLCDEAIISYPK